MMLAEPNGVVAQFFCQLGLFKDLRVIARSRAMHVGIVVSVIQQTKFDHPCTCPRKALQAIYPLLPLPGNPREPSESSLLIWSLSRLSLLSSTVSAYG